ncbi:bifunctional glutamate N-acetyltransferase/amino-acid acetyltransferase ArgJ [Rubellimicrobium sp. CFH 75288]|uniref:bifunctional glutamate N-acetyltransferase/amino-acid acetyltransferase ArgJ n=1 Tax=Rubellimicrobium sp. CFH 75288 TaxID=2697034 RepID=UPI0014130E49|nr:bifunctional glutamate N-acetyltransferase/amino-acid acetyltransferase ArgJ [Rubellimicrobium sp. CFH 75288]NAZ37732.1 bifunctional glutamate N-acetyltransferase/amino-acid acetyltransferase ArgJ [Rubellimicrobium sp. CFH 75288]
MKAAPPVSPLAPARFPDLPPIAGLSLAAGAAGVRYRGRTDVLLARISGEAALAGCLTRSATRSAPVLDCERKLAARAAGPAAILVNSGNSNAFTGRAGEEAVARLAHAAAEALDLSPDRVLAASTGVIGEPLPWERIAALLPSLAAALAPAEGPAWEAAARAIMTTDTFPKGAGTTVESAGGRVAIAGIAKGSGMIAPDMATMLAFVFTDAAIPPDRLADLTRAACERTFNRITVDGDTSTSDTLLVAATGASGVAAGDDPAFAAALEGVMRDLALQIVRDGEGATKLVEVAVTGAASDEDARRVALSIANSPLVKTACAGGDANWGRIVMAVGKSGARADRDRLLIRFGELVVARDGARDPAYSEEATSAHMAGSEIRIGVDLGLGDGEATVWTCDLTHGYVSINADYRS